jgi:uncharacterized protein YdaU (DUF1376 family)
MLQHGSYTLLMDACYDREAFPTLEQAIEWTWASTEAEIEAVKFVLSRFFTLDKDGCYVQDRILQELLHYHKNAETNKRIADEREAKRREKSTNRVQVVDEPPPNHKPLTINQEPRTTVEKKQRGSRLPADFEIPDDWISFCQTERPDLHPHKIFDGFKDYWVAAPKGTKLDWTATWRNWVRNQKAEKTQESFYERDQKLKRERMKEFTPHVAELKKIDPLTGFFIEEVNDVYAITSR